MNKMQMAHDYFMKHENTEQYRFVSVEELASVAWKYADAMQAEADKREDKTRPDVLKEEWQPDWSQAPEWAKWWVKESAGSYWWVQTRPVKEKDFWLHKNRNSKSMFAPSFNYQGNWKNSLRKRPQ